MDKELYEKLLLAAKYIEIVTDATTKLGVKKHEPERIKDEFYKKHQFKHTGLHALCSAVSWITVIFSAEFLCFGIYGLLSPLFGWNGLGEFSLETVLVLLIFPGIVFPVSLISAISLRCHTKIKEKKRDKLCVKETTPLIEQSKKEYDEMWNSFNKFVEHNHHVLGFLPAQYHNGQAVSYMLLAISDGRADTLKEVMNLYESQLHRWKMENAALQATEAQQYTAFAMQEISRHQAEINATLKNIEYIQWYEHTKS